MRVLEPRARAAVVLRYYFDLDYAAIAAILGTNANNVGVGGIAGTRGDLPFPEGEIANPGWPALAGALPKQDLPPEFPGHPFFLIHEVPASGTVRLEYRPPGGPAQVTWVLRNE